MTVGELMDELAGLDKDMPLVVYSAIDEGYDLVNEVTIMSRANQSNWKYCKGDHPLHEKHGWVKADVILVIG
jgi:hypothetical protein